MPKLTFFQVNHIVSNLKKYNITQFENTSSASQYNTTYRLAKKYVSNSHQVLDWGCGLGHFSYYLSTLKCNVNAYAFEKNAIPLLKEFNCHFTPGNESEPIKLPFENNTFNVVVSVGVLEHVHETGGDQFKSLEEIKRILKINGHFLCYHLPNKFSLIEFIANFLNYCGANKFSHTKKFSKQEAIALFNKAGFDVIESGRYCFLPRNSLSRLPSFIKNSRIFYYLFNLTDDIFNFVFGIFSQNIYLVATPSKN